MMLMMVAMADAALAAAAAANHQPPRCSGRGIGATWGCVDAIAVILIQIGLGSHVIRIQVMSNRAQLLRVAEFAMARGGARPLWYDGVRLVPPASFPSRTEVAAAAGSPKPKALPKIVFEQDAFYSRIRHKFPQLQKEPFSLAHRRLGCKLLRAAPFPHVSRSRPMDIRSHAARVYALELQRATPATKRLSPSDAAALEKTAFNTACAFIEQALSDRLRTFHPLVARPAVTGGVPVQSIARVVQQEEETYIAESQEFVEQQSRDEALAAQAEAAAKTLMLQQVRPLFLFAAVSRGLCRPQLFRVVCLWLQQH